MPTSRKPIDQLGELQRAVLEALWEEGSGTVQQVADRLGPKRKLAYTTVLTTLQNLAKAGWVKHTKQGKAYVYAPAASREKANAGSIAAFVKRAFGGDSKLMLQTLIDGDELSPKELNDLRKLIDAKRKEK